MWWTVSFGAWMLLRNWGHQTDFCFGSDINPGAFEFWPSWRRSFGSVVAHGSWIRVVAPALQKSTCPHTREYWQPPFRAVAGVNFEAVEKQAARKKTVDIKYLLCWSPGKIVVGEGNNWKFCLHGLPGGTCLGWPTGENRVHLKMGLIFVFLSLTHSWLWCLARRWEGITVRDSLRLLLSLASPLKEEEENFVQAALSPRCDCLNHFPGCLPSWDWKEEGCAGKE